MSRPDFTELARQWLVRVMGYPQPSHIASLAKELERVFDLGAQTTKRPEPKPGA